MQRCAQQETHVKKFTRKFLPGNAKSLSRPLILKNCLGDKSLSKMSLTWNRYSETFMSTHTLTSLGMMRLPADVSKGHGQVHAFFTAFVKSTWKSSLPPFFLFFSRAETGKLTSCCCSIFTFTSFDLHLFAPHSLRDFSTTSGKQTTPGTGFHDFAGVGSVWGLVHW